MTINELTVMADVCDQRSALLHCETLFVALLTCFAAPPPTLIFIRYAISALYRFVLPRFGSVQNGRQPSTPFDSPRRGEPDCVIADSPRCVVAEKFTVEYFTKDSNVFW
jgi:hypothetical protein